MVSSVFGVLLEEIGKGLHITGLRPDKNESCLIHLKTGLEIQLELDKRKDHLILCADLGDLPPGRYRIDLFKQALRANTLPHPRWGTFAWSSHAEHLVVFEMFRLTDLTSENVVDYISHFLEKCQKWKEAIERQELPQVEDVTRSSGGMFGLRP